MRAGAGGGAGAEARRGGQARGSPMPPGEGQGRVSAGEGGGGRPARSLASSSRARGGACRRRRLLLPSSAPAQGALVRWERASERVSLPPPSVPSSSPCWVRWRRSGSLASQCGPSSWEKRRGGRSGRRRLRASLRHLSQSVVRPDGCVGLPAPRARLSRRSPAQLLPGRLPPGSFRVVLRSSCRPPVGGRGRGGGAAGGAGARPRACEAHARGGRWGGSSFPQALTRATFHS